jgi:hypothetical protein
VIGKTALVDGYTRSCAACPPGMPPSAEAASFAVQRRRESRRQEWSERTKLARLLTIYLDPETTFWTSLKHKPLSRISGLFQKRRGIKSGVPDLLCVHRGRPIFVELKSRAGVASKAQKQIRAEMLPAGATWWMARSARAAMTALHSSAVVFRRPWKPPRLRPWEGPFARDAAAAAGAGRGGAATGGTTAVASATAHL